jgi:hypothetical protein
MKSLVRPSPLQKVLVAIVTALVLASCSTGRQKPLLTALEQSGYRDLTIYRVAEPLR